MKIGLLIRESMLEKRPYKMMRLREEAEARGHTLVAVDLGELSVVCRSGGCEVMWRGMKLPQLDVFYWAFEWDDTEAWDLVRAVDEAGYRMYMRRNLPLSDKVSQAFLLARAGVRIPATQVVSAAMLRDVGGPALEFPLVMKGRYGARGELVRWVCSLADIHKTVDELGLPEHEPFVLQEAVYPLGRDVRALVIDGEVAAAMERVAQAGDFRANFSAGAEVMVTELSEVEKTAVLKAAAAFGAPHAGVDFIRSAGGPVVLEVNMWPGLEGIEAATGLNIAGMILGAMEKMVERVR